MHLVTDFGATGVAEPAETLRIEHTHFKWLRYTKGTEAQIYRRREGAELDSVGIQRAINHTAEIGGGTVEVPPGDYLIGPISLRSHVTLHLQPGAHLWGSPDIADYEPVEGEPDIRTSLTNAFNRDKEGLNREYRRLISAQDVQNIAITGRGQISAQSPAFIIPWLNSEPTDLLSLLRPLDTFLFYGCEDMLIEGISIRDTPSWSVVMDSCRGVRIEGIDLHGMDIINSDGLDMVNTSDVVISNCRIHCTDDAICLKNPLPGTTMRNIVVTNCVLRTLCNGFKIGTDSAGNFENITIDNLVMHGDDGTVGDRGGINLNALDGGTVRNVNVSNIVMNNMFCPFYLYQTLRPRELPPGGEAPGLSRMESISITNIIARGTRYPCYIVGHPDRNIRDMHLANIRIHKSKDFREGPPSAPVPEVPGEYPTPFTFGSRDRGDELPANGLYLRYVEGLTADDFRLRCQEPDGRELMLAEHCSDIELGRGTLRQP
ncbi:MAG: glycosyl hydrolase family 28 protein [Kiritimatiellae bacterium]|jgi:polygalacturonase|nr:glycosyl hydrolase family 28 protein [Kiritimatiellia bacterium]